MRPGGFTIAGRDDLVTAKRDDHTMWLHEYLSAVGGPVKGAVETVHALDNAVAAFGQAVMDALAELDRPGESMGRASDGTPLYYTGRTDLMLACYPGGGAAYGPHIDNGDGDGRQSEDYGRCFTVVYYLNEPAWDAKKNGGSLRVHLAPEKRAAAAAGRKGSVEDGDEDPSEYEVPGMPAVASARAQGSLLTTPHEAIDIPPTGDTIVIFRADRVMHEVRPASAPRFAATVWLYAGSKEQQLRAQRLNGGDGAPPPPPTGRPKKGPSSSASSHGSSGGSSSKSSNGSSTTKARCRAGVVTTVKNFGALAESWCTYHLEVGFAHLFIYFDDPAELKALNLGAKFPSDKVTAIPHDASLIAQWQRLPHNAARLLPFASTEVQTRQQLNARHAVGHARRQKLEWLVHIDADELFWPGPSGDAARHFAELSAKHVTTFVYMNYEAVPESNAVLDPFVDVTLFKRALEEVDESSASARAALDFWHRRQAGCYFYYYDNGKAAVKVAHAASTLSVHEWLPDRAGIGGWRSNLRWPWPERTTKELPLAEIVQHLHSDARILHYPCFSAQQLAIRWRRGMDNYRLQGAERPPSLHEQVCRDAQAAFRSGGEAAALETIKTAFEEKVMLRDSAEAERQQKAKVCERIRGPQRTLKRAAVAKPTAFALPPSWRW